MEFLILLVLPAAGALSVAMSRSRAAPPAVPTLTRRDLPYAIEMWKAIVTRFYKRREVVWRVWLGLWGLPTISLVVRPRDGRTLLSETPAWALAAAAGVFVVTTTWWAWLTWTSTRRDHFLGRQWAAAIAGVLPSPVLPAGLQGSPAGRVGVDLLLPYLVTLALYSWIVYLAFSA